MSILNSTILHFNLTPPHPPRNKKDKEQGNKARQNKTKTITNNKNVVEEPIEFLPLMHIETYLIIYQIHFDLEGMWII